MTTCGHFDNQDLYYFIVDCLIIHVVFKLYYEISILILRDFKYKIHMHANKLI